MIDGSDPTGAGVDLNRSQPSTRPVEHPDLLMVLQVPASKAGLQRVSSLLRP